MSLSSHIKNLKDYACIRATGSGVEYIDQLPPKFHNCIQIYLSYNSVSSLENIIQFKQLNTLLIQFNNISTFESLLPLTQLRFLHTLRLEGNPVCKLSLFYLHVLHLLPNLKNLNGKKPEKLMNQKNACYLGMEIDLISHIINVHFIYEVLKYVLDLIAKEDNSTTTPRSKISPYKSNLSTPNKTNPVVFDFLKESIQSKKPVILESESYKEKITQKLRESGLSDDGYIGFLRQEILNYDQMIEELISELIRITQVSQRNTPTTTPRKNSISNQSPRQNDMSMNENQTMFSDAAFANELTSFRFILSNLKGEDNLDKFLARQEDIQASSYRIIGMMGGMELEPLPDSVKNSHLYSPNYSPLGNQKQMNLSFGNNKFDDEDDFSDEINASKIDPIPLPPSVNDETKELFEPIHPKSNTDQTPLEQKNESLLNSDDDNSIVDLSNQNENAQIPKNSQKVDDKKQDDTEDNQPSLDISEKNENINKKEDDGEIDNELQQIVKNCDSSIMNKISSQILQNSDDNEINEEEEDLSSNDEKEDKMAQTITPLDTKQFSDEPDASLFSSESSEEEDNNVELENQQENNEINEQNKSNSSILNDNSQLNDSITNENPQQNSLIENSQLNDSNENSPLNSSESQNNSLQNSQLKTSIVNDQNDSNQIENSNIDQKQTSSNQNQASQLNQIEHTNSNDSKHNQEFNSSAENEANQLNENEQNQLNASNSNEPSQLNASNSNKPSQLNENEATQLNENEPSQLNENQPRQLNENEANQFNENEANQLNESNQNENSEPNSIELNLGTDHSSTESINEFIFQNQEDENSSQHQHKTRNSSDEFAEYLDSQTDDEEKKNQMHKLNKQKQKKVVVNHLALEKEQNQDFSDNEKGYESNDIYNTATLSFDEKMQSNEDAQTNQTKESPLQESNHHNDEDFDYSDNDNNEATAENTNNSIENGLNYFQESNISSDMRFGGFASSEKLNNSEEALDNDQQIGKNNEEDNYSFNSEEDDSDSFQRKIMSSIPKPILKNQEDHLDLSNLKNEDNQPRRSISFNIDQLPKQANNTKQNKINKKVDTEIEDMYFDASRGESMSSSNQLGIQFDEPQNTIPLNEGTDGTQFDASCGKFVCNDQNSVKLRFELNTENNNDDNLLITNQDEDSFADESRDIFESTDQHKQGKPNQIDMNLNDNQTISHERFDINRKKSSENLLNPANLFGGLGSAAFEASNGGFDNYELNPSNLTVESISQDDNNTHFNDDSIDNSDLINKDEDNEDASSSRAGTSSALYQRQNVFKENASSSRAELDSYPELTLKAKAHQITVLPISQLLISKLFNLWKSKTSKLNKRQNKLNYSNDSCMKTTTAVSFSNSYASSFVSSGNNYLNNYDYIQLFTEKRALLRKIDHQRDLNRSLKARITQYKKEATASQKYQETMSMISQTPQSSYISYERVSRQQPQNWTPLQFSTKNRTSKSTKGNDPFTQYRNHVLKSTDDE